MATILMFFCIIPIR